MRGGQRRGPVRPPALRSRSAAGGGRSCGRRRGLRGRRTHVGLRVPRMLLPRQRTGAHGLRVRGQGGRGGGAAGAAASSADGGNESRRLKIGKPR